MHSRFGNVLTLDVAMSSSNRRLTVLVYGDIGGSIGYIRYCEGLFGNSAIPEDLDVTFVCSTDLYEKIKPLSSRIHVIAHPWPSSRSRIHRYLWHLFVYPCIVHRTSPDIEFYPSGQLRVYLRKAVTVATCHNLLLFDDEELERLKTEKEKQFFQKYRRTQSRSLLRASGVIFLSEHSRHVVQSKLQGIVASTVIGHGLDPRFRVEIERSYELPATISVLYVSPILLYKNQANVVRAIRWLREKTKKNLHLRLVGGGSPEALRELNNVIRSENAEPFVELVGMISYEQMADEYRRADIFLFASASETFGITLLEAMGAKLAIACSDRTGLEEFLKDAGVYFSPADPHSIAGALEMLISDQQLRQTLGDRAYRYSQEYTWERSRLKTFDFIRAIYERSGRPQESDI